MKASEIIKNKISEIESTMNGLKEDYNKDKTNLQLLKQIDNLSIGHWWLTEALIEIGADEIKTLTNEKQNID